jgi:hypothetical protein
MYSIRSGLLWLLLLALRGEPCAFARMELLVGMGERLFLLGRRAIDDTEATLDGGEGVDRLGSKWRTLESGD